MTQHLFAPVAGSTVVLAATTTTGSASMGMRPSAGPFQVRAYNDGTTLAYIEFGDSTVTATTSSIPLPAGVPCGFTITNPAKAAGPMYFAVKMASSTANISVTVGHGF